MVNTGELIKQRRKELKISVETIAQKLGVNKTTVYRWEKGEIEKVSTTVLKKIAEILNTDPTYFLGYPETTTPTTTETPTADPLTATIDKLTADNKKSLLSYATDLLDQQETTIDEPATLYDVQTVSALAAGHGFSYDDFDIKTKQVADEPPRHDIASLVDGDSMLPDYVDGDVVYLVDKGFSSYSGQVCAVVVDDETFIKKVYTEPNGLRLVSINPDYPDKFIDFPPSVDTHIKIFSVVGTATPIDN